ncbi:hypothetical protein AAV95_02605 [Mycolicibacterium elephantis]|uniref:hypothetical protein n=1 Tax=Mycolicibacterium elephantis TaxID=81858 RepID=UPI000629253A|nr:hypothetical protein [Mycolicibacterium elephantis]KKW66347.1 hypothetical protein AAV95_02605 [Mycolicibacterium elephantis]
MSDDIASRMRMTEEKAPIFWYLTVFHEAGHAVAALRSDYPVNEIYIDPNDGFVDKGTHDDNEAEKFIVSAGPWAEARAIRVIAGVDGEDGFTDLWRSLFRKNKDDWRMYHEALGHEVSEADSVKARESYFFPDTSPPSYEDLPGGGWDAFPADFWDEVRDLAMMMLEALDDLEVGHGQPPLQRIEPMRWRKPGWIPDNS